MTYQHGRTNGRTFTEADRAAAVRRNQELAAELRRLDAIGERLAASVAETRARLEAERDAARAEFDALRAERTDLSDQTRAMIRYRARMAELPAPVYGGREGLLAACAEIDAHDNPGRAGNSHGTKRAYYEDNCRCAACGAWYDAHRTRERDRYRAAHNTPGRHLKAVAA